MREVPDLYDSQTSLFSTFEDKVLVRLANDGDEFALNTLINRYKNFVKIKARSYFLVGADREDIVQEGMIGLYKAIRDYSEDKNTTFKSFAELCVTRQIISAIKAATRNKHLPLNNYVSLNRPIYTEDGSDKHLIDMIEEQESSDPFEVVVNFDEVSEKRITCDCILSGFEKEVLTNYLNGFSYDEMACSLDKSVKSIDNALQRIKRKVDSYMRKNGKNESL